MSNIDQQFIEYIVKSLVSNPDAVQVERRIDERGVLLELTVSPDDLGRVIGKRGATAQSLRTLLRALGTKNDARYNLKIVDNGAPAPSAQSQATDDDGSATADDHTDDHAFAAPQPPARSDDLDDEEDATPKPTEEAPESSSLASKTRKELEELDDLDV